MSDLRALVVAYVRDRFALPELVAAVRCPECGVLPGPCSTSRPSGLHFEREQSVNHAVRCVDQSAVIPFR